MNTSHLCENDSKLTNIINHQLLSKPCPNHLHVSCPLVLTTKLLAKYWYLRWGKWWFEYLDNFLKGTKLGKGRPNKQAWECLTPKNMSWTFMIHDILLCSPMRQTQLSHMFSLSIWRKWNTPDTNRRKIKRLLISLPGLINRHNLQQFQALWYWDFFQQHFII